MQPPGHLRERTGRHVDGHVGRELWAGVEQVQRLRFIAAAIFDQRAAFGHAREGLAGHLSEQGEFGPGRVVFRQAA